MQLWLSDPTAVEKLQAVKNEKDGGARRKRPHGGGPGSGNGGDSGSDRSSPCDPYSGTGSADSPGSGSASKKPRVYFSDEQKEALKIAFALDPYPSTASMDFLSQELGLESRSISNWFHNHRMRLKQQLPHGLGDSLALLAPREGGQGTFDPMKFKLLVHQRMLEMQAGGTEGEAPSSVASLLKQFTSLQQGGPGLPGLPGLENLATPGAGLDLSYKSRGEEGDDDKDSIAESNDGSNKMDEEEGGGTPSAPSAPSAPRSRRKPAAPQWVRPEWMGEEGKETPAISKGNENSSSANKEGLTINGVCVMNSLLSAAGAAAASAGGAQTADSAPKSADDRHDAAEQEENDSEPVSP